MLRLLAPQKESNLILAYPAKPNKPIHRNIIASGLAFDLSSRCAVDCRQGRATGVSNYLSDGGGGGSVRFTRGGAGQDSTPPPPQKRKPVPERGGKMPGHPCSNPSRNDDTA